MCYLGMREIKSSAVCATAWSSWIMSSLCYCLVQCNLLLLSQSWYSTFHNELVMLIIKKSETCPVFLSSYMYRNMSGSLGEREMLWKVLPNFHKCFYNLIETRRTCFLFLLENTMTKKEHNLLTLIIKM